MCPNCGKEVDFVYRTNYTYHDDTWETWLECPECGAYTTTEELSQLEEIRGIND